MFSIKQLSASNQHKISVLRNLMLLALGATVMGAGVQAAPPEKPWKDGRILVKPRAGLPQAEFEKILKKQKGKALGRLRNLDIHVVEVPSQAEDAVARALSRNPHVKFAEKDMLVEAGEVVPNDPEFANAWHLPKVEAPAAWEMATADGITIAILDTGVDTDHPDLAAQVVSGWNPVSGNTDTSDINGHGTKVAGTAAASTDNALGVAAIGWGANIMPVRITNRSDGYAYWSDIASGLTWAADHGADVANISYNATNSSSITSAAQYMRNRGGVVVVAGGNDGEDPGWGDNPAIVSVSATTSSDGKASWSNHGDYIDVAAPGAGIRTTAAGGGYGSPSGTSFASPATAGLVALIMGANPDLSPDEVESVLEASADDLVAGSDWHAYYGHGRINAAGAVAMALNMETAVDNEAPTVTIFSPSAGSTVSGPVPVDVDASDNVGVTEVALYAGGELIGVDASAPYEFSWDSTNSLDSNVVLTAYGYDAAGNEGSSNGVEVVVDNTPDAADTTPPTVNIVNPTDGDSVNRTVTITVDGWDETQLASIALYIDGQFKSSTPSAPLSYSWNTRKVASGNHTIRAESVDAAGNSAEMSITVSTGSDGGSKGKGKKK